MKANTYVTIRLSWAIVMVLVAGLFTSLAGIGFTVVAQNRADQRWCDLLTVIDQPLPPDASDRQRDINREIHKLRLSLGC